MHTLYLVTFFGDLTQLQGKALHFSFLPFQIVEILCFFVLNTFFGE